MISSPAPQDNLALLLSNLEKKYGKGIIMPLHTQSLESIPSLSTGFYQLDTALGRGLPWGRLTEIYGLESSGKTTLALHCLAQAQKKGHKALFIDAEHAFDMHYAQALGIDVKNLLICQPDYGEQALDVADKAIRSQAVKLIVIDSVSALIPEAELKGDIGDHSIGAQARLMSQAMRKIASNVYKSQAMILFINQVRHKIGVTFGSSEVTSGGNALKFYASIRIKVTKGPQLKDPQGLSCGQQIKVKIVKNKIAPPFKEVTLDLFYGQGISPESDLIDAALQHNLIQKTGSWFSYQNKSLAQGKDALRKLLKTTPTLQTQLHTQLRKVKSEE